MEGFDFHGRDQWFSIRVKIEIFNRAMELHRQVCVTKKRQLPLRKTPSFDKHWQAIEDPHGNFCGENGQRYSVSSLHGEEDDFPYEYKISQQIALDNICKSANLHEGRSATVAWRTMIDYHVDHFSKNPGESRKFQPVIDRFRSIFPDAVSNHANPQFVLQNLTSGRLAPFFWRGYLETAVAVEPSAVEASFKAAESQFCRKNLENNLISSFAPEAFRYAPLETGPTPIRLLVLYPALDLHADIVCCLCNTTLDRSPDYEALSYVWGDSSRKCHIRLNGTRFAITENLGSALRNIRATDTTVRVLWVDALCINQNDMTERRDQVCQMEAIYSQARQVIVWLGPGSILSDRAFAFLAENTLRARDAMVLQAFSETNTTALQEFIESMQWEDVDVLPQLNPIKTLQVAMSWFKRHRDDLQALTTLYERPWFERVWTVQELIRAKMVIVQCGARILQFESFVFFEKTFLDFRNALSSGEALKQWFGEVHYERFLIAQSRVTPLVFWKDLSKILPITVADLFLILAGRKATDPRDLLFALRGLLPDDSIERQILIPDYSSSVADVYTRFSREYINLNGNLDILCWGSNQTVDLSLLPSWVLDWRMGESGVCYSIALGRYVSKLTGMRKLPFLPLDGDANSFIYNASLTREVPGRFEFSEDSQILFANGIVVDTISNTGDKHLFDMDIFKQWKVMVEAESSETYPFTQQSRNHVFWVTMLADEVPRTTSFKSRSRIRDGNFIIEDSVATQFPPRTEKEETAIANVALHSYSATALGRCMFLTTHGYIGLGPHYAAAGDIVVVMVGSMVPLVLRQYGRYHFVVGESYVHGIMDGEIMSRQRSGDLFMQRFLIG